MLLDAADRTDASAMARVLDDTVRLYGLPAAVDDVVLPALREIGDRWSRGRCDTAQESLAFAAIQGWLRDQHRPAPGTPNGLVVLSGGPAEDHTLGLEALGVLLGHHGVACLNLGGRVPAATLRAAVTESGAAAVVLSCQLNANRASAVVALQGLHGTTAALYFAGAGFRAVKSRRGVPGTYLGGNLSQTAALLAAQVAT